MRSTEKMVVMLRLMRWQLVFLRNREVLVGEEPPAFVSRRRRLWREKLWRRRRASLRRLPVYEMSFLFSPVIFSYDDWWNKWMNEWLLNWAVNVNEWMNGYWLAALRSFNAMVECRWLDQIKLETFFFLSLPSAPWVHADSVCWAPCFRYLLFNWLFVAILELWKPSLELIDSFNCSYAWVG